MPVTDDLIVDFDDDAAEAEELQEGISDQVEFSALYVYQYHWGLLELTCDIL